MLSPRPGGLRDAPVHSLYVLRKWAEDALRESEERFRDLFASSRGAMYITNVDGGIVYVDESAPTLLGFSKENLI